MLTDLITTFSALKEGELFVVVGKQEKLYEKSGSRKARIAGCPSEDKIYADEPVLKYEDAKKYYSAEEVGSLNKYIR